MGSSAWEMDLSGHNHRHRCPECDAVTWHEGKRAECEAINNLCVDCITELEEEQ